jgi:hypothetical protein
MARHESDREDLFDELAALSPRVELQLRDAGEIVCAGRRESTGGWSLFFGPDRVYHFDASGRLRRAYVAGFLYRSDGETLSQLRRERTPTETALLRRDLDPDDLAKFLKGMRGLLREFVSMVRAGEVQVLRSEPAEGDVLGSLQSAVETIVATDPALAPAIRR